MVLRHAAHKYRPCNARILQSTMLKTLRGDLFSSLLKDGDFENKMSQYLSILFYPAKPKAINCCHFPHNKLVYFGFAEHYCFLHLKHCVS